MLAEADSSTQPEIGLRKCEKCNKGQQEGLKLRKCAGCSSVMYCSKECQKESWAKHKAFCQRFKTDAAFLAFRDMEAQQFGYESAVALSQAMTDFTEAHAWALEHATIAHCYLRSGPSMDIALQEPRTEMLRFRFQCQTTPDTPRAQRNPSTTFKLLDQGFFPFSYYMDGYSRNSQLIGDTLKLCRDTHEKNLKDLKKRRPDYVGVVPVMYTDVTISVQLYLMVPIFRPPRQLVMDNFMKAALHDFTRFCAWTINTGIPLRAVNPRTVPYYGRPGRVVRPKGKGWTWEPLFDDWASYEEDRVSCRRLPGLTEEGLMLPPNALMRVYCAFYLTDDAGSERVLSAYR
ncbi:uncharacterized protein TRAVEDRAFT_64202 [Trametes versicolor FP-101664 SS1]|uniref:uncharacterized protein n=1 Tax=Trametes versicolor (strain FP-101664) TaxID=717944 RepID=UPI0004624667|nr:uncharacterized protein TRAVEDRAFT_64202 [Trametes versicolor FP-101664 SS1]EIW60890.1 hypothetical protein TRAVEDRAFT_64202 [Trametes versicolor FP-101664 SS1]